MLMYLNYQTLIKQQSCKLKELKDVLNGQCDIIGFTLEAVQNMMCDICLD